MTEVMASTYKEDGIIAVAIHPGSVPTPGVREKAPEIVPCESCALPPIPGFHGSLAAIVAFQRHPRTDNTIVLKDDISLCGAACVFVSNTRPQFLSGRYVAAAWDFEELEARKHEIETEDKLKFRMVV